MGNFFLDLLDGLLSLVDSAFRDGWIWYVLIGVVVFGIYLLFFVKV